MSLSIISTPQSIVLSAGNNNIISCSGDTQALPMVVGYQQILSISFTSPYTGPKSVTFKQFPDPTTGIVNFNLKNIFNSFMSFDMYTSGGTGVLTCPNSSVKAGIYIGEEYTSGSTLVSNPSLVFVFAWTAINGCLSYQHEFDTNLSNFILQTASPSLYFLSDKPPNFLSGGADTGFNVNVYEGLNDFAYVYNNNTTNFFNCWTLNTYSDNFTTQIGSFVIPLAGQFFASGTTALPKVSGSTNVMCAAIDPANLRKFNGNPGILATLGDGSNMLPTSAVTYTLQPGWQTSVSARSFSNSTIRCTITTPCGRTSNQMYQLFWMNTFGGFDSWLFSKKSETTQTKTVQGFKRVPKTLKSDSRFQQPTFTVLNDKIVISTDFLSDVEISSLRSVFTAPVVFMVDTSTGIMTAVEVNTQDYRIVKKVNQKLYALELEVQQTYNDYRQEF